MLWYPGHSQQHHRAIIWYFLTKQEKDARGWTQREWIAVYHPRQKLAMQTPQNTSKISLAKRNHHGSDVLRRSRPWESPWISQPENKSLVLACSVFRWLFYVPWRQCNNYSIFWVATVTWEHTLMPTLWHAEYGAYSALATSIQSKKCIFNISRTLFLLCPDLNGK